jgi:regulatory protein YycI of two-component signal transduction system YycFG
MKTILTLTLISICLFCQFINAQANQKNRVIILTDIEADPDETQSMIRIPLFLQH